MTLFKINQKNKLLINQKNGETLNNNNLLFRT